jgi:hypothetical protein
MRELFRRHPRAVGAFLLASVAALWFLVDLVGGIRGWDGGRPEPVQPWMTVGYVGRAWDLDPRAIDARAGLPLPADGRPFTLQEIADDRGVPVDDIIAIVERTVRDMAEERHGGDLDGDGQVGGGG